MAINFNPILCPKRKSWLRAFKLVFFKLVGLWFKLIVHMNAELEDLGWDPSLKLQPCQCHWQALRWPPNRLWPHDVPATWTSRSAICAPWPQPSLPWSPKTSYSKSNWWEIATGVFLKASPGKFVIGSAHHMLGAACAKQPGGNSVPVWLSLCLWQLSWSW